MDCDDGTDEESCDTMASFKTCSEMWEAGRTEPRIYQLGKFFYFTALQRFDLTCKLRVVEQLYPWKTVFNTQ